MRTAYAYVMIGLDPDNFTVRKVAITSHSGLVSEDGEVWLQWGNPFGGLGYDDAKTQALKGIRIHPVLKRLFLRLSAEYREEFGDDADPDDLAPH